MLSFSCVNNFKLYQIDVEITFLNYLIKEEVNVKQCPSFEIFEYLDHVFKILIY